MQKLRKRKMVYLLTTLNNFRDRVFGDRETLKNTFQGFDVEYIFKNNDGIGEKT